MIGYTLIEIDLLVFVALETPVDLYTHRVQMPSPRFVDKFVMVLGIYACGHKGFAFANKKVLEIRIFYERKKK